MNNFTGETSPIFCHEFNFHYLFLYHYFKSFWVNNFHKLLPIKHIFLSFEGTNNLKDLCFVWELGAAFPHDYLLYQHICVLSHTYTAPAPTLWTRRHVGAVGGDIGVRSQHTSEWGQDSFNTDADIDTLIVSLPQVLTHHTQYTFLLKQTTSLYLETEMESTEVRAPQLWRRPHAKIYNYNQDFSANYYSVIIIHS